MDIELYTCYTDKRYIRKTLSNNVILQGSLRNESSVTSPRIVISADNPALYNYAYIPAFGRYYYVNDWQSLRTGIWECNLSVDVLMTYADELLTTRITLANTQDTKADTYLTSEIYKAKVKQTTEIINFDNGLLEQGEYILITAGG